MNVDVVANTRPTELGGDRDNLGFPVCTATVNYEGGGYLAMMGWVQLVRSTDADLPDFEIDPFFLFPDADSPYAFYGHTPTLFDGPGRTHRADMNWLAHSFLAATSLTHKARQIRPLAGFSWGFNIRRGEIEIVSTAVLGSTAWLEHIPYLEATYPKWRFESNRL